VAVACRARACACLDDEIDVGHPRGMKIEFPPMASLAIPNGAGSVRNVADGFRSMPRPAVPIPPIARHGVVSGRHANVKLVQRRVANSAMVKVKHVHEKESQL
jgi:hypothetical protein